MRLPFFSEPIREPHGLAVEAASRRLNNTAGRRIYEFSDCLLFPRRTGGQKLPVGAIGQMLENLLVDVLREKLHGAVAEKKPGAGRMMRTKAADVKVVRWRSWSRFPDFLRDHRLRGLRNESASSRCLGTFLAIVA